MGVLVVANFQQYVNSLDKQEYNKFLRPILVCSKLSQNHTFQNHYHRTIQICTYYHRTLVDVFCISVSFMKITFYHLQILWHTFQNHQPSCCASHAIYVLSRQFSFRALCWLVYLPCKHRGTKKAAFMFAPIVIIWLLSIGGIGLYNILHWNPNIYQAVSIIYG